MKKRRKFSLRVWRAKPQKQFLNYLNIKFSGLTQNITVLLRLVNHIARTKTPYGACITEMRFMSHSPYVPLCGLPR